MPPRQKKVSTIAQFVEDTVSSDEEVNIYLSSIKTPETKETKSEPKKRKASKPSVDIDEFNHYKSQFEELRSQFSAMQRPASASVPAPSPVPTHVPAPAPAFKLLF